MEIVSENRPANIPVSNIPVSNILVSNILASNILASNILAERYASAQMVALWSPREKILRERKLWIAVMEAQKKRGVSIPDEAIESSRKVVAKVDLESIARRELITRHDVKARIEEFCELSQHQYIHIGLTSRDVTENVEQSIVNDSLKLIHLRAQAALARLGKLAGQYADLTVVGRTHNVAAQPTTLGKRFATAGEELLSGVRSMEEFAGRFVAKGIKGPVGTSQDIQTQLVELAKPAEPLKQEPQEPPQAVPSQAVSPQISTSQIPASQIPASQLSATREFESEVLASLGISQVMNSVGQTYPRSMDMEMLGLLCRLVSGPASLALTIRLMAGHGHIREGFTEGQTGSTAMPHKMNARLCERIGGFKILLSGYLSMATELAGTQWNEGDVSCSVVRRVMLPDAFYACDGLLENFICMLDSLEVMEESITAEVENHLLQLGSTTLLSGAVQAGAGREEAHKIIAEHSRAVMAEKMAENLNSEDALAMLAERLDGDAGFPLSKDTVLALATQAQTGMAVQQVKLFCEAVENSLRNSPEARNYQPRPAI